MKLNHYKGLLFYLLTGFLLNSCATGSTSQKVVTPPELQKREVESARQVQEMNEKLLMSNLAASKTPYKDYRIGPEDLLEITVFEVEKLNKTVRVSAQGNISLPLLGVLRVKGLTANELERRSEIYWVKNIFRILRSVFLLKSIGINGFR